jgi:hypothetical protein
MRWSDAITLIKKAQPVINENGFQEIPGEVQRVLFGNKKAAWQSDFYQGLQAGVNVKFRFTVRAVDYMGEEIAEYDGKRYKVLKADVSKNGELIDLTISDLSERD